ncbi:hypothetical protein BZZ01_24345 [Nostocales cyanobacterium HT-58-2]|nr:hypothetical protein BZZ01_24345 [Nostocales cyanobacterium HT-58-2]
MVSDGALNAVDYCKKNASSYFRSDKTRLLVATSNCSDIVHKTVSVLKAAGYNPKLNLNTDQGLSTFIRGAVQILGKDKEYVRTFQNVRTYFGDKVAEQIGIGAVGLYAHSNLGYKFKNSNDREEKRAAQRADNQVLNNNQVLNKRGNETHEQWYERIDPIIMRTPKAEYQAWKATLSAQDRKAYDAITKRKNREAANRFNDVLPAIIEDALSNQDATSTPQECWRPDDRGNWKRIC